MIKFPAVAAFQGGDNLIRVVGHRGARGVLPENTMIGFEFAMSTGAHLLEFDVVMSADMVPVITHNQRLHAPTFRTPDGCFLRTEPKVSSLTWAQIQTYDVGRIDGASTYGQRFPDQAQMDGIRVPRLSDLLECAAQPKFVHVQLMLEIKSDPDFSNDPDYRARLIKQVVAEVRAAGFEKRTLLHSFDWKLLEDCQRYAPDIPASFLTQLPENDDEIGEDSPQSVSPDFSRYQEPIPDLVANAGGLLWCPYLQDIDAKSLARARELSLVVAVWTVNEVEDINRMIDLKVDAIVSDYPGRVQRCLADRGFAWA